MGRGASPAKWERGVETTLRFPAEGEVTRLGGGTCGIDDVFVCLFFKMFLCFERGDTRKCCLFRRGFTLVGKNRRKYLRSSEMGVDGILIKA